MEKILADGSTRSETSGAHENRVSFASHANDPIVVSGSASPSEQYLRAHRSTQEPSGAVQPSLLRSLGSSALLDGNSKTTVSTVLDRIAAASSTLDMNDGRNSTNNSTASFPASVNVKAPPSLGFQPAPGGGYSYGSSATGSQHRSEELDAITRINVELVDAMGELQNTIILMEAEHKRQVALLQEEMTYLHDEIAKMHRENSRLKERVANDVLRERQTRRFEVAYEKANIATRVRRAGLRHLESTEERMMEMHDDLYFVRRCDSMRAPVLKVSFVLHFIDGVREYPFVGEASLAVSVARELFMEAARTYAGYHVCTVRAVDVFAFHSAVAALNFARECHVLLLEAPWSKRVTANSAFSVIRAIGTAGAVEEAADREGSRSGLATFDSPSLKRLRNLPSMALESTSLHDVPLSKKKKLNTAAKHVKDGAHDGEVAETSQLLFAGPRIRTCLFGCNPSVEVNSMTGRTLYYGQHVQQMCEAVVKDTRVGEIAVNRMWCKFFSIEHNIIEDRDPHKDIHAAGDTSVAEKEMIQLLSSPKGVDDAFLGFVEPTRRIPTAEVVATNAKQRWEIEMFSDASQSSSSRLAYSLLPWSLRMRRQCPVFTRGNIQSSPVEIAPESNRASMSSSSNWRIIDEFAEKQAKKFEDGRLPLAIQNAEPVVEAETWAPFASEGMAVTDILLGMKGLTFVVPSARRANYSSGSETKKEEHPMWLAARKPLLNSDGSSGGTLLTIHTLKEKLMSVQKRKTVIQRYCESLENKAMEQHDRYEIWRATSRILPNEVVYICTVDLLTEDVWSSQLQRFLLQYDERYPQYGTAATGGAGGGTADRRAGGESNAPSAPVASTTVSGKAPGGNSPSALSSKAAHGKPKKKEVPNDDQRALAEAAAKEAAAFAPRWSHELLMALREALATVVQNLGAMYSGVCVNGNGLDLLTYAFRAPEQAMAFVTHVYEDVLFKTKEVLGLPMNDDSSVAGDDPTGMGIPKTMNPSGADASSPNNPSRAATPTSPSAMAGGGKNAANTLSARGDDQQRDKKLATEGTLVKSEEGNARHGVANEEMLILVRAGISRGKVGAVRRLIDPDLYPRVEDSMLIESPSTQVAMSSENVGGDSMVIQNTTSGEILSKSPPTLSSNAQLETAASIPPSSMPRTPLSSPLTLSAQQQQQQQNLSHGSYLTPDVSSRMFKSGLVSSNGIISNSVSATFNRQVSTHAYFPTASESQASRSFFKPEQENDTMVVGNVGPGVRLSAKLCDRANPGEILVAGDVMAQFYAKRENLTSRTLNVVRVRDDGYNPESLRSVARAAISRVSANASETAAAQAAYPTCEWDFVLTTKPNAVSAANAAHAKRMGVAAMQEEATSERKGPSLQPPPPPPVVLNAQANGFSQKNVFSVLPRQYAYRRKLVRTTLSNEWIAGLASKWTPANAPDQDASRIAPAAPTQPRTTSGPPAARKMTNTPAKTEKSPSVSAVVAGPLVNPTPDTLPFSNLFAAPIRRVYPALTRGTSPSFTPTHVCALMTQLRARVEAMEENCMSQHDTYTQTCAHFDEAQEDYSSTSNTLAAESDSIVNALPLRNVKSAKTASVSADQQDSARGGPHSFSSSSPGGTLAALSSSAFRTTLPLAPSPSVQISRACLCSLALLNERAASHIAMIRQPHFDPVKLMFMPPPLRGFLYCALAGITELLTEMVVQQRRNPERFFGPGVAGDVPDAVMIGMAAERVAQLQEHYHYIVCSSVHDARGTLFRYRPPEEFVAYFPAPHDALDAAAQIQDRLLHTNWPENVTVLESSLRVKSPTTGQLLFNGVRAAISVHCASCLDGGDQWLDSQGNHVARDSAAAKAAKRDAKETVGRKVGQEEKNSSENVANMIVSKQTIDQRVVGTSKRQPPLCVSINFTGGAVEKTVALGHTANGGDILLSGAMMHYLVAPQPLTRLGDATDDATDYTRRNHVRDAFAFFSTHGYNSSGAKDTRRRSARRMTAAPRKKSTFPEPSGASSITSRVQSKTAADNDMNASRTRTRRTLAVSGLDDAAIPTSVDLNSGSGKTLHSKAGMLVLDDADDDNDAVVSEAEKLLHRDENAADRLSSAPTAASSSQRGGKRDVSAKKTAAAAPKEKAATSSGSSSKAQEAKVDTSHGSSATVADLGSVRRENLWDAAYLCIPRSLVERMKLQLADGHPLFRTVHNAHEKSKLSMTSSMTMPPVKKSHATPGAGRRAGQQPSDQDWKPIIATVLIENDVAVIRASCAIEPQNSPWAFPGCARAHYEWYENSPLLRGALERKKLFVGGVSLRLALRGIYRPMFSRDMQRLGVAIASHNPSITKLANRRTSAIDASMAESAMEHEAVSALHAFNARTLSQMTHMFDNASLNHHASLSTRDQLLQASLSYPCVFSVTPTTISQATRAAEGASKLFNGSAVDYLCGLLDAAACVLVRGIERSALRRHQLQAFLHHNDASSSGAASKDAHVMSDYAVAELPPPSLSVEEKSHHSLACILIAVGSALRALGTEGEIVKATQHDAEAAPEEAAFVEREGNSAHSPVDTPGTIALMKRESHASSLHMRSGNDPSIPFAMQKAMSAIAATLAEWDTFKSTTELSNSQPHSPATSNISTFSQVKNMHRGGSGTLSRSQNRQAHLGPLPPDRRKKSVSRPAGGTGGGNSHPIPDRSPRVSTGKYSKSPVARPSPSPAIVEFPLLHASNNSVLPKLSPDGSPTPSDIPSLPVLAGRDGIMSSPWAQDEEKDEPFPLGGARSSSMNNSSV